MEVEGQSQRVIRSCYADFEDEGRDHQPKNAPKNAGGLEKLENTRAYILS